MAAARVTTLFLLAFAGALQTLAGALAMPDWIFLSASGFGGTLLLGVLALRVRASLSCRVVKFLARLLALIAVASHIERRLRRHVDVLAGAIGERNDCDFRAERLADTAFFRLV